jgi:aryl-alcohol dehydrogenase-like predicted oxidoreductase
MSSEARRLALGTAQFGLDYGIANRDGQVGIADAQTILAYARGTGLDTLDTAKAYGASEQRLGEAGVDGWRITTKLPPLPADCADVAGWVHAAIADSLARLRVPRLEGVLLHRPQDLLTRSGRELYDALRQAKRDSLTERIGVSIYDPEELDALMPQFELDLVQAPFNVFDQRLERSGWLDRLGRAGVTVHTRSVFLQGLLLMPAERRPAKFEPWGAQFRRWDEWLADASVTPLRACLSFVLSRSQIDRIVVGVDTPGHLREIVDHATSCERMPPDDVVCMDVNLINPARWSRL